MGAYDKSSKWLIEHHGDSILRLADDRQVVSWRPLPVEQMQLGQLPDGLLEVRFSGSDKSTLVLLELATYPERRVFEQVFRDLAMVYLSRRVLPEALVVVLCPRGRLRVGTSFKVESLQNWSTFQGSWRVVELWNLSAADMLSFGDPGLVPWASLAETTRPAEEFLRACRDAIEQTAADDEKEMLTTVTRVLASLKYKDDRLLSILGGKMNLLEFPAIQELLAEQAQDYILRVLRGRFGDEIPDGVVKRILTIGDEKKLKALVDLAATCPDIAAFRRRLGK